MSSPGMTPHPSSLLQPKDSNASVLAEPHQGVRDSVLKDRGDCDPHREEVHVLKSHVLEGKIKAAEEVGPTFRRDIPVMDALPALWLRLQMGEEFVCGWGAAFINITATFPLNKVMFRQQLQGIPGYKALAQLRKEGLRNLYRGLLPPLLLKTTTMSIMFGSYNKFQMVLDASFPHSPRPLNHAQAALMAGTLETILTPFERIQTLLQDRTYYQRFQNTVHATQELRAFGLREYYRGGTVILLRNGPSNVFFFLGKEFVNDRFPALQKESSHIAKDFVCGACLGAVISTVFFPMNVLKTRMQSQLGGPFMGILQAFQEVWVERNRSLSNLFRGVHINYTRSFISWGIINASYEYLIHLFRRLRDGRS